jgi:hypothetical protein
MIKKDPSPPPAPIETPSNISKTAEKYQDMNFKVSEDFHTDFKLTATAWKMSMKELMEASYKLWVENNGNRPKRG